MGKKGFTYLPPRFHRIMLECGDTLFILEGGVTYRNDYDDEPYDEEYDLSWADWDKLVAAVNRVRKEFASKSIKELKAEVEGNETKPKAKAAKKTTKEAKK